MEWSCGGHEPPVANAIPLEELKEILIVEYCPRREIQKMEQELWDLTV